MAYVERTIEAPREDVFAVLANGWTYSDWVVGTAHIRAVDEGWPKEGSQIHHKAGPWPLSLQDRTRSVRCVEPELLMLEPHVWPLGEAVVTITLDDAGPSRTTVRIREEFRAGPMRWLRTKVDDLALHHRNRESLRRLADLAKRRSNPAQGATVDAPRSQTSVTGGTGDAGPTR
jgi:uncharacterized protein YndB with AHSA1/START domain